MSACSHQSSGPGSETEVKLLIVEQVPGGFSLQEAVTLPNNFVTVFHAITTDLGIETPWPRPEGYRPEDAEKAILVWGGASSVGQYALQILRYYGCECPSLHRFFSSTQQKQTFPSICETELTA